MKQLRYICVQPTNDYYTWQVEVMINNFIKNGIHPNHIDVVCATEGTIPAIWTKLAEHYNNVRFFFYPDTRKNSVYISSIRPHILEKHFTAHPYLKDEAIFYHDCDMVFVKPPTWNHLLKDDTWYLSDTEFYISADYIKSKKYGIYERMCEIVGIDESIPEHYNKTSSGGAQYLMKNVDAAFWKKVYDDSEKLYQFFLNHLKAFPQGCLNNYHPIQKWTADMWAVLWNAWYFKHETKIIPEMDFIWAINPIDNLNNYNIYHNAGVLGVDAKKYFFKHEFVNKLPYDVDINTYDKNFASVFYVKEILETAKISCLVNRNE